MSHQSSTSGFHCYYCGFQNVTEWDLLPPLNNHLK